MQSINFINKTIDNRLDAIQQFIDLYSNKKNIEDFDKGYKAGFIAGLVMAKDNLETIKSYYNVFHNQNNI
jgi:hypothetical protein